MDKDSFGTMNAARFAALAEAFGGRLERWPDSDRAVAAIFAATDEGRVILDRAARLDRLLDGYVVKAPDASIHKRIIEKTMPAMAVHRRLQRWWAGFGLVGVGLAGVLTGVLAASIVLARTDAR